MNYCSRDQKRYIFDHVVANSHQETTRTKTFQLLQKEAREVKPSYNKHDNYGRNVVFKLDKNNKWDISY